MCVLVYVAAITYELNYLLFGVLVQLDTRSSSKVKVIGHSRS